MLDIAVEQRAEAAIDGVVRPATGRAEGVGHLFSRDVVEHAAVHKRQEELGICVLGVLPPYGGADDGLRAEFLTGETYCLAMRDLPYRRRHADFLDDLDLFEVVFFGVNHN